MEQRYFSEACWTARGAPWSPREFNFTLNPADEHDWPSGHAWDARSGKPEPSLVLRRCPEFRIKQLD